MAFATAILFGLTAASAVHAQSAGACDLISSRDLVNLEAGGGNRIVYISRPVFSCAGDTRIRADSAVVFTATNFSRFIGGIEFEEGGRILTAERANYFSADGRLIAWEGARLEDPARGTVVTGDSMRFLMATELRPENELEVSGGRPHAVLVMQAPSPDAAGDSVLLRDSAAIAETALGADSLPEPGDSASGTIPALTLGPDALPPGGQPVLPDTASADSVAVLPVPVDTVPADTVPADRVLLDTGLGVEGAADTIPGLEEAADTIPADTVPPEPFDLYADRLFLQGESYLRAVGTVEVLRDSLEAYSDSLEYDTSTGLLALRENAQIISQAYSLSGREVDLLIPANEIREIHARHDAVLIGDQLDLTAPQVRLYLGGGTLERLVAVDWATLEEEEGEEESQPTRLDAAAGQGEGEGEQGDEEEEPQLPRADAEDFVLTGDSLEVWAPGGSLERVVSAGAGRGESTSRDSLNSESTHEALRSDWIEGDTITADFQRVFARQDSMPSAEDGITLFRLTAAGHAMSLYRLDPIQVAADSLAPPQDTANVAEDSVIALLDPGAPDPEAQDPESPEPALEVGTADSLGIVKDPLPLHFVAGDRIIITMRRGEVEKMQVEGQTKGLYLEPNIDRRRSVAATGAGSGGSG